MATNVASSAINSINLRGLVSGGDAFDEDAFGKGAFGRDAMAGVAAGMAGNAVTVGMGNWNLGKDAMKVDNFNSGQISQMQGLNSFMGGLASSGVTYAMTDNATFNVARIKGTGVLEMHVGKDGFGMNVGMGGTDISLGTIANAVQGAQHWRYNSRIESRTDELGLDIASTLRSQYGFGDIKSREQLDLILDGSIDVKKRTGETSEAESVTENGRKVVYLDNYREGMSREEQLRKGITLQHEAWRDGVVDENNVAETQMAAYAHTLMTERIGNDQRYASLMGTVIHRDATLAADMTMLNKARESKNLGVFAAYVDATYDSSGDYWRVTKDKDGNVIKVQDDGDYSNVNMFDERGNYLGSEELKGRLSTSGLAGLLNNGQTADELNTIMWKSGLNWNENDGWFARNDFGRYLNPAQLAHPGYEKMVETEQQRQRAVETERQKQTPASEKDIAEAIARSEEKIGLKYGYEGQKFDENWIVQGASTSMDCIGLVSYGYQTPDNYPAGQFDRNPFYTNIQNMSNTKPMTGDVMDLVYTDKKGPSAHVMIYLGSNGPLKDANGQPYSDQYMEAYSYIKENVQVGKVRYNRLSNFFESFERFNWTIESIEYYRRNQFQK